jgi:hypothetical protein|tara:strand:- start:908 stop:1105 length:198 start_codon:yes stop_codon:yes gene_type:complete
MNDNKFDSSNISINDNSSLSYQQKYYINNKEKIKLYQKEYYENKRGNIKNYNFTVTYGKFILFKD